MTTLDRAYLEKILFSHINSSGNSFALKETNQDRWYIQDGYKRTSPVKMLLSNCRSRLTSINLRSAGTFSPIEMYTKSPVTNSLAGIFSCTALRSAMTSDGSMPLIDDITREVEKSCQALKKACITRTSKSTTASARLETSGFGLPSGFLARKLKCYYDDM